MIQIEEPELYSTESSSQNSVESPKRHSVLLKNGLHARGNPLNWHPSTGIRSPGFPAPPLNHSLTEVTRADSCSPSRGSPSALSSPGPTPISFRSLDLSSSKRSSSSASSTNSRSSSPSSETVLNSSNSDLSITSAQQLINAIRLLNNNRKQGYALELLRLYI